ncbi:MAG: hypothetical protein H0W50_11950 [Parachlamydiaceae bacterium]|nr:hypothetical protein [Parachlamydiaceae bacterium]
MCSTISVVGSLKSAGEFIVGSDLVTGEEASRWMAAVGLVPGGKIAARVGKVAFNVSKRVTGAVSSMFRRSNYLDGLSRSGKALDRSGLTKAGRALDKHGNRFDSSFPKATGDSASKNMQGQFQLDDILTNPQSASYPNRTGGCDIFSPDGRGIRFDADNNFTVFLQPRRL